MRDYKKYSVWQKSHDLVLDIYKVTSNFPKDELFGLISQIKDPQAQFQPVSQKAVEEILTKIFVYFYIFHLGQLMN
jgi:hypothetical protein